MLKLYRPIKTSLLTQGFGVKNTKPDLIPLYEGYGLKGHNGWDLMAYDGEPVYFNYSGRGKVVFAGEDEAGGLGITVISEDENGCHQFRFWHLKSFAVKVGDIVETGDLLGYADNTGISTGTHLHFDFKPLTKIADGIFKNTHQDNGYLGAVSPEPHWENIFVVDLMKDLKTKVEILKTQLSFWQRIVLLWRQLKSLMRS